MSEVQGSTPAPAVSDSGSQVPKTPAWQRLSGIAVVALSALLVALVLLHGVSKIMVLGGGGFRLPSPEVWLGFQQDSTKTAFLASEQWGGILSIWIIYGALVVALIAWGLPRLGNPEERTSLQSLIGAVAAILFSLLVVIIGIATAAGVSKQNILIISIPMVLVALPPILGGFGILVVSLREGWFAFKTLQAERPETPARPTSSSKPGTVAKPTKAPKTGKAARTSKASGKTIAGRKTRKGNKPKAADTPQVMKLGADGKIVPRKPGRKGGAK